MKKKIIQSLTVLSMAVLMIPVCIQSNKEIEAAGRFELNENFISIPVNKYSHLYAGTSGYSNMLVRTADKETNGIAMVKESKPSSIVEIKENDKTIEDNPKPETENREVRKIKEIRKNAEDYIPEPMVVTETKAKYKEIVEEPKPETYLSESDIRLIATVTMAEAEGESEYGKRLVIDTILNRMDSERFPNTVSGVIYQKSQFSCMWDGRIDVCYVKDDIYQLVVEELNNRTDHDVIFFRTRHYHNCGHPMFKVDRHYFSSL